MFARPLAIPREVFASGGSRGGARAPTLFWMKKEEMTEGRKAGWASKIEPGPLLGSKSGSAAPLNLPFAFVSLFLAELTEVKKNPQHLFVAVYRDAHHAKLSRKLS